ncbi:hypothetical protein C9374_011166 [Naegleria lovaniensis]|uniref:Uncharacterized protein n=1 Tax=Naegleria lovaniensis TaxID=51637 RepID=A0AA88GA32_NAELO|nr:uncharacterized protein C9374_011166 [Naegleria lovaniensis]KAG2374087.1 hypothetical protein C9374_011166 [Naegleria lovaniensis]
MKQPNIIRDDQVGQTQNILKNNMMEKAQFPFRGGGEVSSSISTTQQLHSSIMFLNITEPAVAFYEYSEEPQEPTQSQYELITYSVDMAQHKDESVKMMGSIVQVLTFVNSDSIFLITDCGMLYRASCKREPNTSLSHENRFSLVPPFDGSTQWKALQMHCYSEAMLIIAVNSINDNYCLFGIGSNGYYRMTKLQNEDFGCSEPQIVFDTNAHLLNAIDHISGKPPRINHVGCCFSFSCCIVDDYNVHTTGQNWYTNFHEPYHCWSSVTQRMSKKVVKMDCGDFHVVLLHEDASVSIGGRNNAYQFIKDEQWKQADFVTLDLNTYAFTNIFCGSNAIMWVRQKDFASTCQEFFITGDNNRAHKVIYDKSSLGGAQVEKMVHQTKDELLLEQIYSRQVFDVQYSRDFLILRYFDMPHLLFIDGTSYYGGYQKQTCCVDLRSIMPITYQHTSDEFFRKIVRVQVQNMGVVVFCDLKTHIQMCERLLKALELSNPNNHLLYDISFVVY